MSQQVVQKLSNAKQKLSLGEVKKAEKEKEKEKASNVRRSVRNSVVNPEDLEWPYISEEDEKELIDVLSKELSVLSIPNINVPLEEIKKVDQDDRRKYRHIYFTQRALEVGFDTANYTKLRTDISIGANCVSRGIDQNIIKAAIIEKDVEPSIITKMLIPVARSKNIPIIAIHGLSETCQKVFKTKCIAFGLKSNCVDISHRFHRLFSLVCSIHEKISKVNEKAALAYYSANPNTNIRLSNTPESSSPAQETTNQKRKPKSQETFKPPKVRKV